MAGDAKLGKFLREVSNWSWEEFVRAEHDKDYSSNQAMIFAVIRSCAMQKMDAIKMSLNRLDGKLKTPVKIEYPKIFYLYPNATLEAPDVPAQPTVPAKEGLPKGELLTGDIIQHEHPEPEVVEENDLPSLSLRETLTKMSDYPRELPERLVACALAVEQAIRGQGQMPDDIPRVKSVVAAHLLILAQNRNIGALTEVFDQIDGKLAETIQIIGEDLYITSYGTVAPPGAKLNDDGVLQIEATQAQKTWAQKLSGTSI